MTFCHICVTAIKTGRMKVSVNVQDSTFVTSGISNWKDASRCNHEQTTMHKTAVEYIWSHYPKLLVTWGEILSSSHAAEKQTNKQYILKVAQNSYSFFGKARYSFTRQWGWGRQQLYAAFAFACRRWFQHLIPFTAKDKQVYQLTDTKWASQSNGSTHFERPCCISSASKVLLCHGRRSYRCFK